MSLFCAVISIQKYPLKLLTLTRLKSKPRMNTKMSCPQQYFSDFGLSLSENVWDFTMAQTRAMNLRYFSYWMVLQLPTSTILLWILEKNADLVRTKSMKMTRLCFFKWSNEVWGLLGHSKPMLVSGHVVPPY